MVCPLFSKAFFQGSEHPGLRRKFEIVLFAVWENGARRMYVVWAFLSAGHRSENLKLYVWPQEHLRWRRSRFLTEIGCPKLGSAKKILTMLSLYYGSFGVEQMEQLGICAWRWKGTWVYIGSDCPRKFSFWFHVFSAVWRPLLHTLIIHVRILYTDCVIRDKPNQSDP